ncbi:MAG: glycosyltransferase [Candidatus Omnitrophota bacterium]|nr:glycosyltransferase [Candidatus Omnitrophota bacterium]
MKIIVTYASAGAGHLKAAEAIYFFLKENHKGIDVKIIDILDETNAFFRFSYHRGYLFLVNYAFFLWRIIFWLTYLKPFRFILRPAIALINYLNTKKFQAILIRQNPDFIISTHFFSSEISARLKTDKKINSEVISVITDFCVHPFWISGGTFMYIAPCEITKKQLSDMRVKESIIKDLGIPIHPKFLKPHSRAELCKKIGIENKFTVLIVTGSFGIGPIERCAAMLHREAQLVVVCARNKKLHSRLKLKNYPNCLVLGRIENMQEIMQVSDVIITKPGGLTIAEFLAMELVPIFICAIPGQETENVRILEGCGIGRSVKKTKEIKNIVLDFKEHPEKLSRIRDKIREIKKPNAVREICDVVC